MVREDSSDSSSIAVGVAVVLILVVVGGAVLVGGWWFARSSAQTQALLAMQREAMAMEQEARARAELAAAEADVQVRAAELAEAGESIITLQIDAEGATRVEGEPTPLADLRDRLAAAKPGGRPPGEVQIQVHPQCTAAAILDVIQICEEVGLKQVRLAPLKEDNEE